MEIVEAHFDVVKCAECESGTTKQGQKWVYVENDLNNSTNQPDLGWMHLACYKQYLKE